MSNLEKPPSSVSKISVLVFLVLLALFLMAFASSFYTSNFQSKVINDAQKRADQAKSEFDDSASSASKERRAIEKAQIVGNRSEWLRYKETVNTCVEQVEKAKNENEKRMQLEASLLDTPQGSVVIKNDANLRMFSAIQERYASSLNLIRDWQVSVSSYKATADEMLAIDKPVTQVPKDSFVDVIKLRDESAVLAKELEMANRQLEKFANEGKSITTSVESLREAISKREADLYAAMLAVRQNDKDHATGRCRVGGRR